MPARGRRLRKTRAKRVDAILAERPQPRNALERLVRREGLRTAYTQQLQALLPPALAPHCSVAALAGSELVIHVAGAGWATRLRLELPKLAPRLQALGDFAAVREIRIRTGAGRRRLATSSAGSPASGT